MSLILIKIHPMMPGLSHCCKLPWSSYSVSIAKPASYRIDALIQSWSFFLLRMLVVSINILCDLAWDTVFMTRLMFLIALWIFEMRNATVGLLIIHLKLFWNPHCLNVASLSLFYRYCFGRCWSELAELFYFLIWVGDPLDILKGCMIFHHY